MSVKSYDPGQVAVIVGGKIISGFSEGTMVKASRNDAAYSLKVGADGEGTRTRSRNTSGKLEFSLMQSSDSNDYLSSLALADEASNAGTVACLIKDGSGRSVWGALTAWVQKLPDADLAKEVQTRTWVLETDNITIFIGGN